jgi:hypothetical protein
MRLRRPRLLHLSIEDFSHVRQPRERGQMLRSLGRGCDSIGVLGTRDIDATLLADPVERIPEAFRRWRLIFRSCRARLRLFNRGSRGRFVATDELGNC